METTLGDVIVATGYQLPRRPIIPFNSLLQIFRRQTLVLLLGDLNARHPVLGTQNNPNSAGEAVATQMRQGTVQHVGPDFKIFITTKATGTPDIVLTNAHFIHNMILH